MNLTTTIYTYSGGEFDFAHPETSVILIEDIAHALANTCRFNGHTIAFYSVAQHSVMVSQIVPPEDALAGLLHDAAETYIGDMVTPLKRLLDNFREVEDRIEAEVLKRFGISAMPASVKPADLIMLATEKRDLLHSENSRNADWLSPPGITPLRDRITPLPPQAAKQAFLQRYAEIRETRQRRKVA